MSNYPYADRFATNRSLPERGMSREEVLSELRTMATEEDAFWETGKCSGTMYCGDHDHYHFMNEAFGLFAHVNVLQRDMCPSATKFEAEIIAMTLSLHAGDEAAEAGDDLCGLVTTGGTGSILHAMLAYREYAAQSRGITQPNVIKPETAHPAFDKACHLFGIELRRAPIEPVTTQVDVDWVRDHVDENTVALIGSACNYGYGTVDPIGHLSDLALERGIGLHVDACLGGFILPFGRELGYDIPAFDYSVPGVTSISADTHKYGYAFKGSSVLSFRSKALRNAEYFYLTDWSGGKYTSPGMEGSRSGGLIAATWAAMVQLGHAGYLGYAAPDLRDVLRDARGGEGTSRAAPGRPANLPLLVQLRRIRHLSRERLHADQGVALQRPAVPQCAAHGGDAPADPASGGGRVRGRPGRRRCLRQGTRGRGTPLRSHLRRGGRGHDARGGRVHPRRHGRHARRAVLHPRQVTPTDEGPGPPRAWIEGCVAAQEALDAAVADLSDAVAHGPSPLPGWTVGHVLTHLARNADSLVWRLEGAARGEEREQYPGGLDRRAADIEAGAARPAAVLVRDVRQSSAAVERTMAELPLAAWDAPSRTSRGVMESSRDAVLARWREVVVHHGDLGLGPVPLPPALVDAWLPRELPRLAERTDPAGLLFWIIGRGEPPVLTGW